ncbi:MFS transporter [Nonomuraea soli]|uniref:Putative MFS family arabinose efflux permease n=1 Tax=Nonomuraea soli TaxID=1032476 RepID=A0A7W0CG79_9ACTN|nr:MFS transporter [Nonomuraea soli]MBA2890568.1 putative MFS family arabinose efflux permease [Nonomuraea soli]
MSNHTIRFALVWTASLVSAVGSGLTGFVLGVWIYTTTGSPTQFAAAMLSGMIPGILIGPFAGVVIDRFDRRRVMVLTDSLAAASTAAVAVLAASDALTVWHVCAASAVSAACGTFHITAYQAMTPLLIPDKHLARANGLMHVSTATQIAAPVVGGTLLAAIGLPGVLVLDLATFAVAVLTLTLVGLPEKVLRPEPVAERPTVLADLATGLRHLRGRPGLGALAAVMTGFGFLFAVAGVLVQPLILSFSDPGVLGLLMFAGGAGMFAGSLVMGAWGGPKARLRGVALFMALGALLLLAHAVRPWPLLVAVAAAAFLFTLPIVNGSAYALLQSRIDPPLLGRTLGTVQTFGAAAAALAYVVAAPLAEFVAGPLMAPGGALAGSVGALIGVGEGRGIALVLAADGLLLGVLAALTVALPRLRRIETPAPGPVPAAAVS